MRVTDHHHVDAGHRAGDDVGRVLDRQLGAVRRGATDARVRQDDDDVGLLGDAGHPLLGGLDHVAELQRPLDVAPVPDGRARRREPQDPDGDGLVALHLHALERVRLVVRLAGRGLDDVGTEHGVVGVVDIGVEQTEPVVVLVVPDDLGVVADRVVGGGHRVHGVGLAHRLLLGVVVGQRGALDRVAVVDDEDAVLPARFAHGLHGGRDPCEAGRVARALGVRRVPEVVPVLDPTVQVRRREHGQLELVRLWAVPPGTGGGDRREGARGQRHDGHRSRDHCCSTHG